MSGLLPRVPILQRYIARELLFVAVLTATVLTSLTALCGLLQPLRKHGVTTTEMMEILFLLFPVFLIFTVPFAVMLACCWVYGRLSADNELNACASSGINVQTLLIVPLVLGLLAMTMNVVLANWLVPNWALARIEVLLARHGKDIIYRKISRTGSFSLDPRQLGRKVIIHADEIDRENDALLGIGVVMFYKGSKKVEQVITAQRADLRFFSSQGSDELPDSIAIIPQQATVVELPSFNTTKVASLVFSGTIREKMRQRFSCMSLDQLLATKNDPQLYNPIRHTAQQARRVFVASQMVKGLQEAIKEDGFFELFSPERRYRFSGQLGKVTFGQDEVQDILQQATIEEYNHDSDEALRTFADIKQLNLELVQMASHTADGEKASVWGGLSASMVLRNAYIRRPDAAEELLEQSRFSISDLEIPQEILARGKGLSLEQIKQGDFTGPRPKRLGQLAASVRKQLEQLSKRITLEIHSRMAMAVCCPVLAVLGALLGAIFRRGQFLVAVGLSLVPAMVALLFINMGKQMVDSDTFTTGMAVATVWTGLALLSTANIVLIVKVLRK